MPIIHVRPTPTMEAVHASDSDFTDIVREWLSGAPDADVENFLKTVAAEEHKPWVVRTTDGNQIGIVRPANFAADFEDVAATDVLDEVWTERQRHAELGYTSAHDDSHGTKHLTAEALNHLAPVHTADPGELTDAEKRTELIQVASLVIAAIDNIDRAQTVRTFSVD